MLTTLLYCVSAIDAPRLELGLMSKFGQLYR
jgi:hypothetical protein